MAATLARAFKDAARSYLSQAAVFEDPTAPSPVQTGYDGVRHGFGAQENTFPLPGQLPALLMAGYGQHLDKDA